MRTDRWRQAASGFTLVELWVTVVLIALVATWAAPSLTAWRWRDQLDARTQVLLSSLALARSEAMRLGARVTLCRSDARARCIAPGQPCDGGATDWSCGWAVSAAGPAREAVVLRRYAQDARVAVAGSVRELVFTPPAGQVIGGFRSFELTPRAAAAALQGERWRRCVRIAAGGRARVAQGGCRAAA